MKEKKTLKRNKSAYPTTKLNGILNGDSLKFFDKNFALKDSESIDLKIEYCKMKREAIELK